MSSKGKSRGGRKKGRRPEKKPEPKATFKRNIKSRAQGLDFMRDGARCEIEAKGPFEDGSADPTVQQSTITHREGTGPATARLNFPDAGSWTLDPDSSEVYFVEFEGANLEEESSFFAIGLIPTTLDLANFRGYFIGWTDETYAWHGDDGLLWDDGVNLELPSPPIETWFANPESGITRVGVGLIAKSGVVFYTADDRLVYFSTIIENKSVPYNPAVSMEGAPSVTVHTSEFSFDINNLESLLPDGILKSQSEFLTVKQEGDEGKFLITNMTMADSDLISNVLVLDCPEVKEEFAADVYEHMHQPPDVAIIENQKKDAEFNSRNIIEDFYYEVEVLRLGVPLDKNEFGEREIKGQIHIGLGFAEPHYFAPDSTEKVGQHSTSHSQINVGYSRGGRMSACADGRKKIGAFHYPAVKAPFFGEDERAAAMSGNALETAQGASRIGCGVIEGHVFYTYDGELLAFDQSLLTQESAETEYDEEGDMIVDEEAAAPANALKPGQIGWRDILRLHPIISVSGPVQVRVRMHVTEFPQMLRDWLASASLQDVSVGDLLQLDIPSENSAANEVQFMPYKSGEDGGVICIRQGPSVSLLDVEHTPNGQWKIGPHTYAKKDPVSKKMMSIEQKTLDPPPFHKEEVSMTCYEPAEAERYGLDENYIFCGYGDGSLAMYTFRESYFYEEEDKDDNDQQHAIQKGKQSKKAGGRKIVRAKVKYIDGIAPGKVHSDWISALCLFNLEDKLYLTSGSWDTLCAIFIIDEKAADKFRHFKTLEGHSNAIESLYANDLGTEVEIISGSLDSTIGIWSEWTGPDYKMERLEDHRGKVTCLASFKNGTKPFLISGGQRARSGGEAIGGEAIVWDLQSRKKLQTLTHRSEVTALTTIPRSGGKVDILTGTRNGDVRRWEQLDPPKPPKAQEGDLKKSAKRSFSGKEPAPEPVTALTTLQWTSHYYTVCAGEAEADTGTAITCLRYVPETSSVFAGSGRRLTSYRAAELVTTTKSKKKGKVTNQYPNDDAMLQQWLDEKNPFTNMDVYGKHFVVCLSQKQVALVKPEDAGRIIAGPFPLDQEADPSKRLWETLQQNPLRENREPGVAEIDNMSELSYAIEYFGTEECRLRETIPFMARLAQSAWDPTEKVQTRPRLPISVSGPVQDEYVAEKYSEGGDAAIEDLFTSQRRGNVDIDIHKFFFEAAKLGSPEFMQACHFANTADDVPIYRQYDDHGNSAWHYLIDLTPANALKREATLLWFIEQADRDILQMKIRIGTATDPVPANKQYNILQALLMQVLPDQGEANLPGYDSVSKEGPKIQQNLKCALAIVQKYNEEQKKSSPLFMDHVGGQFSGYELGLMVHAEFSGRLTLPVKAKASGALDTDETWQQTKDNFALASEVIEAIIEDESVAKDRKNFSVRIFLTQLIPYLVFLLSLTLVAFGWGLSDNSHDENDLYSNQFLEGLIAGDGFEGPVAADDIRGWLSDTVVPALYPVNDQLERVYEGNTILIGHPFAFTIEEILSECQNLEDFGILTPQNCFAESWAGDYRVPTGNSTSDFEFKDFRWLNTQDVYSSYSENAAVIQNGTAEVLRDILTDNTRVYVLNVAFYNPPTNLMTTVMVSFDRVAPGAFIGFVDTLTVRPISEQPLIFGILEIIMIVFFCIEFPAKEIREIVKNLRRGSFIKEYARDAWNVYEWTIIALFFSILGLQLEELSLGSDLQNPNFVDHVRLAQTAAVIRWLFAAVCALCWMRLMKYFAIPYFSGANVKSFLETLRGRAVIVFSLFFIVVVLAWTVSFHVGFSYTAPSFRTFSNSLLSTFLVMLGEFGPYEDVSWSAWATAFFLLTLFIGGILLLNLFVGIIGETYNEALSAAEIAYMRQLNALALKDATSSKKFRALSFAIRSCCKRNPAPAPAANGAISMRNLNPDDPEDPERSEESQEFDATAAVDAPANSPSSTTEAEDKEADKTMSVKDLESWEDELRVARSEKTNLELFESLVALEAKVQATRLDLQTDLNTLTDQLSEKLGGEIDETQDRLKVVERTANDMQANLKQVAMHMKWQERVLLALATQANVGVDTQPPRLPGVAEDPQY